MALLVRCSNCGAPRPVPLSGEGQERCGHCGDHQPLAAAVRERLRQASALLQESDARQRQLSGVGRLVAGRTSLVLAAYSAVLLGLSVVAGSVTVFWQADWLWFTGGLFGLVQPALAATGTLLLALPSLLAMARDARHLAEATRANPPLRPGAPLECRLCGAPLSELRGVSRCRYCAADNVIGSKVVAGSVRRRDFELWELDDELRSSASRIGSSGLFAVSLASSFALFGLPMSIVLLLEPPLLHYAKSGLDADVRYEVERRSPVTAHERGTLCLRGRSAEPEAVHPSLLLGRGVASERGGRVLHVGWNPFYGRVAGVERERGDYRPEPLEGLCVFD